MIPVQKTGCEGKFTRNYTLSSGAYIRHFIKQNKNLTAAR